jgi:hypothetical protein
MRTCSVEYVNQIIDPFWKQSVRNVTAAGLAGEILHISGSRNAANTRSLSEAHRSPSEGGNPPAAQSLPVSAVSTHHSDAQVRAASRTDSSDITSTHNLTTERGIFSRFTSVTNGVWNRWLDLLITPGTITRNYYNNKSSAELFYFDCRGITLSVQALQDRSCLSYISYAATAA